MLQSTAEADSLFHRAIAAARANDRSTAYELLKRIIQQNAQHEQAWLWLSGVVQTDAERRYCLEQVLMRNPSHPAAQRGLSMLPPTVPVSPFAEAAPPTPAPAPRAAVPLAVAASVAPQPPAMPSAEHVLSVLGSVPAPSVAVEPEPEAPAPSRFSRILATAQISEKELFDVVERELGRQHNQDEAVRVLSQRLSLSWSETQALVKQVSIERSRGIAARQSPFLLLIGVITLIGGIILIAWGGNFIYLYATEQIYIGVGSTRALVYSGLRVLLGCGMVLGSLLGIGETIWKMIK